MDKQSLTGAPINFLNAIRRGLSVVKPHRFIKRVEEENNKRSIYTHQLWDATTSSHDELLRVNTVFPFTLFPDTIVIDRQKVTIANRFFFRVAKINSVPIQDILSVEADVGPFFGSVHISSRYFVANPQTVRYLPRNDALAIQHLLQGYIIAHEKEIDCSQIEKPRLKALLFDLGQGVAD